MKKTKKLFLPIMMLLMFTVTSTYFCEVTVWAAPQPEGVRVYVDGEPVSFIQEPVIVDGQPMLPVKEVAEAAGWVHTARSENVNVLSKSIKYTDGNTDYLFSYHANTIDLLNKRMDRRILVGAGKYFDTPDDHNINFTFPPLFVSGNMLISANDLAFCLYASYVWDEPNKTVYFTSGSIPYLDGQGLPNRQEIIEQWIQFNSISGTLTLVGNPQNSTGNPLSELAQKETEQVVFTLTSPESNSKLVPATSFNPAGVLTSPPEEGSVLANILLPGKSDVTISSSFYKPYTSFVGHGCNWYAFGRFYETYGYQVPVHYSHGGTYLDKIDKADSTVIKAERNPENIVSGCVALYTNQADESHVVFVEYVERDANGAPAYVYYTECMNSDGSGIYKPQEDGQVKKVTFERFLQSSSGTKDLMGLVMPIK